MKFKKLKNVYIKFGFTETEGNVILFLSLLFIAGLGFYAFTNTETTKKVIFNYSTEDSLFNAAKIDTVSAKKLHKGNNSKKTDGSLNKNNKKSNSIKKFDNTTADFKRINLNTANKLTLMKLPGIGEKIANDIIAYRIKTGKINYLLDLIAIKGLSREKINKLRDYVIIE